MSKLLLNKGKKMADPSTEVSKALHKSGHKGHSKHGGKSVAVVKKILGK